MDSCPYNQGVQGPLVPGLSAPHDFNQLGICEECGLEDEFLSFRSHDYFHTSRCVPKTKYSVCQNFNTILRAVISTDLLNEKLRSDFKQFLLFRYSHDELRFFQFDMFFEEMSLFAQQSTPQIKKKLKTYYLKWSIIYNIYYEFTGDTAMKELFEQNYQLMNQMRMEVSQILTSRVNNRTLMLIMAKMCLQTPKEESCDIIRLKNRKRELKDLRNIIHDFEHHQGILTDLMTKFHEQAKALVV